MTRKSSMENVIPDTAITANIKGKLLAEQTINSTVIHVETTNGKVVITGEVPDEEVKIKVESIAKNTDGVKEVQSLLQLSSE